MENDAVELEALRKEDSSWHPCQISLSQSPSDVSLIVECEGNGTSHFNKEEVTRDLRVRSLPLEGDDCSNIKPGDHIHATHDSQAKNLFFDEGDNDPMHVDDPVEGHGGFDGDTDSSGNDVDEDRSDGRATRVGISRWGSQARRSTRFDYESETQARRDFFDNQAVFFEAHRRSLAEMEKGVLQLQAFQQELQKEIKVIHRQQNTMINTLKLITRKLSGGFSSRRKALGSSSRRNRGVRVVERPVEHVEPVVQVEEEEAVEPIVSRNVQVYTRRGVQDQGESSSRGAMRDDDDVRRAEWMASQAASLQEATIQQQSYDANQGSWDPFVQQFRDAYGGDGGSSWFGGYQ